MGKILIKYSKFRHSKSFFNNITKYEDKINSHTNVNVYHLSNETNLKFLAITDL